MASPQNIVFLDKNFIDETTTITLPHSSGDASYLYDRNTEKKITSIGYASDSSTFEIIIDFGVKKMFKCIYIAGLNASATTGSVTVSYFVNGGWASEFSTSVPTELGSTGDGAVLVEYGPTANEFSLYSDAGKKVRVRLKWTNTANSEKTISEIIVTNQLTASIQNLNTSNTIWGSLNVNPIKIETSIKSKEKRIETASGRQVSIRLGSSFKATLTFSTASNYDIDFLYSLWKRTTPFFVLLGGGSAYMNLGLSSQKVRMNYLYRIGQIYYVNMVGDFEVKPSSSFFTNRDSLKIELVEAP